MKQFTINQPNIHKIKRKLMLRCGLSPGDVAMMAAGVKDLMESKYNDSFLINVDTPCPSIWENSPYLTEFDSEDDGVEIINMAYPTIHHSNQGPWRFRNGFTDFLSNQLNIRIPYTDFGNFIHISDLEASWYSAVYEAVGSDVPFWIINAGFKNDFTAKQWEFTRYQEIVDTMDDVLFVQVGHKDHIHPPLHGDNLLNLIGKTDLRELIRLVWNSYGVISPVSLPMVLAFGIPPHPRFNRQSRANITIAGGREPSQWQQGPNHQYLHTCGMLACCDNGGCWKGRVIPLRDGKKRGKGKDNKQLFHDDEDNLCVKPVKTESGQMISKCMDMISADEVCILIEKYMDNLGKK